MPTVPRAIVSGLLVSGACGACTTWQPRPSVASLAGVRASYQSPVRVTLRDGRVVTFTSLVVAGDSLVGLRAGAPLGSARTAVPVADVQTVATREVDSGRTRVAVGSVLFGAGALAVGFLLLVASSGT